MGGVVTMRRILAMPSWRAVLGGVGLIAMASCGSSEPAAQPGGVSMSPATGSPPEVRQDGPVLVYQPTSSDSGGALLTGTLVLEDSCLRLMATPDNGPSEKSWTVIFPDAAWNGVDGVLIEDIELKIGNLVELGGGAYEPGVLAEQFDLECLTDDYFLVGVGVARVKD